jgi:hypothetical protein
MLEQILSPDRKAGSSAPKVSQLKLLYHSLRENKIFLRHQIDLLKAFIASSLKEVDQLSNDSEKPEDYEETITETLSELMAAHKDLVELYTEAESVLSNPQSGLQDTLRSREVAELHASDLQGGRIIKQQLSVLHQMMRLAERSSFRINLDYLRWMISFAWNVGISRYRAGNASAKEDAREFIQFCYGIVDQLKRVKEREVAAGN